MDARQNKGLLRLVYSSRHFDLDRHHLDDIIQAARRNNARLGVTGVLIHSRDMFLQVLEGESDAVRFIYANCALDLRHHDVQTLGERTAEQRLFPDWSMACVALDQASQRRVMQRLPSRPHEIDEFLERFVGALRLDAEGEPEWAHYQVASAAGRFPGATH